MSEFNLMESAIAAGVSPRTISRYIESGKLSARKTAKGHVRVDASELIRVFNDIKPLEEVKRLSSGKGLKKTSHDSYDNSPFELLKEQNKLIKEQLEAALIREQKLLDIVAQRELLLEHQKSKRNWLMKIFQKKL